MLNQFFEIPNKIYYFWAPFALVIAVISRCLFFKSGKYRKYYNLVYRVILKISKPCEGLFIPNTNNFNPSLLPKISIHNKSGTVIKSIWDGKVEKINNDISGLGKYIIIKHKFLCLISYRSYYCHLSKLYILSENTKVKKGQSIGEMGATGHTTGSHLGFALTFENMLKN